MKSSEIETKQQRNERTSPCDLCRSGYRPISIYGIDPYTSARAPHAHMVDGQRTIFDSSMIESEERENAALAELRALARANEDRSFEAWEREMHTDGSGIVTYWEGE